MFVSAEEFEAKYIELDHIGARGRASVYAGLRRDDNVPVSVTHTFPNTHRNTHSLTKVLFPSRRLPSNISEMKTSTAHMW